MTGGRVAILGPTGVNFAAGMSGGIAYVFDETGLFDDRCNLGMVDLELMTEPKPTSELRNMIEQHVRYTGSHRGQRHPRRLGVVHAALRQGLPDGLQASARRVEPGGRGRGERRGGEGLSMSRERAFLESDRQDVAYRPVAERVNDFSSVDVPLTDDEIQAQAARCMDCGTPVLPRGAQRVPAVSTSSRSSTSSSTTAAGKRRSTSCCTRTVSRNSPGGSVRRHAKAPACWA